MVTGDVDECPVHVDDQAVEVGDQHPFARAIEHRSSLAQTLAISVTLTQLGADAQTAEQPRPGDKDQAGAEQHPNVTVDQLPSQTLERIIEETVQ
ncbi:hypothetical protein D3C71_1868730 [compost metagenome]